MPQPPDNVEYRLVRAFEVLRQVNSRPKEERVDYVRSWVMPMIPKLNCPVMRRALKKASERIVAKTPPPRGGPRVA